MMPKAAVLLRACAAVCGLAAWAAAATAELCGRPREAPEALYERLTKTEKLPVTSREKGYVTVNDAAKETLWTFTLAGHPAHPSVVCRRPVKEGDKVRIEMGVQCGAAEKECDRLLRAFRDLNQKKPNDAGEAK